MKDELFLHIKKYIPIEEDKYLKLKSYFELKSMSKKELLMKAGDRHLNNYFVVKGCLHMYFVNGNGSKQTIQFAIENWWMTDFLSFHKQDTTDFYIQAVEKSDVLSISHGNYELLLKEMPELEKYFRKIYEIAYGSSLVRMKHISNYSKEEMYFHFVKRFPGFEQRVPQYLIASFLGLTPEYVSEIRAKKRS